MKADQVLSGERRAALLHGEALEVLAEFPDSSLDSMVTDPPAGISFMGKTWDHNHGGRVGWCVAFAAIFAECLRVLKPGVYVFVWALPRTSHWTMMALEDGGFEIRDVVTHHFGTGFPKSLDVSKAMDKAAGLDNTEGECAITAPATDAAKQWAGWGTALKPASEHWILARKPLVGTVATNVAEHGTGALNVDACRIQSSVLDSERRTSKRGAGGQHGCYGPIGAKQEGERHNAAGRWPPNLLLTHAADCGDECVDSCPVREMDRQSGDRRAGGTVTGEEPSGCRPRHAGSMERFPSETYADSGGASRFFPRFRYVAKASARERSAGLPEGEKNKHPTVKSVELLRWLCCLVTPPGGVVLDPFMGSGSTGVACAAEGFRFIGIEREKEYTQVAAQRISAALEKEIG